MKNNEIVNYDATHTEQCSYDTIDKSLVAMDKMAVNLSYANDIANVVSDAALQWKQMDLQIAQMDKQLTAYLSTLAIDLEKYRERIPIVREQLNSISNRMDKILDKALLMDTTTDNEVAVKLKLMEMLDNYTDKLAAMMVKLL